MDWTTSIVGDDRGPEEEMGLDAIAERLDLWLSTGAGAPDGDSGGEVTSGEFHDCPKCGGRPNRHPTTHIEWGGQAACVDVEIAELILLGWQLGVITDGSCQDWNEESIQPEIWISFRDVTSFVRFAELVYSGGPRDDLYDRIEGWSSPPKWEWSCHPAELDIDREAESIVTSMFCSVVMPKSDIAGAITRIRQSSHSE